MCRIKIPPQDFLLKMQGGGWGLCTRDGCICGIVLKIYHLANEYVVSCHQSLLFLLAWLGNSTKTMFYWLRSVHEVIWD